MSETKSRQLRYARIWRNIRILFRAKFRPAGAPGSYRGGTCCLPECKKRSLSGSHRMPNRGVRCGDDCTANGSVPWRRILVSRSFAGRVCAGEESPETELRVATGLL